MSSQEIEFASTHSVQSKPISVVVGIVEVVGTVVVVGMDVVVWTVVVVGRVVVSSIVVVEIKQASGGQTSSFTISTPPEHRQFLRQSVFLSHTHGITILNGTLNIGELPQGLRVVVVETEVVVVKDEVVVGRVTGTPQCTGLVLITSVGSPTKVKVLTKGNQYSDT